MNKPLELVRVVNNKFEVIEETANLLSKISEPIGVLSIVGLYRTGKSFLLNQLIETQKNGFKVEHTVKPGTKGLWIWGNPISITNERKEKFRLITIDSEGIGSFSANETQDAQIFALALLLSSFFIYNSSGSIDDNAIQRLGVVTELSKYISKRGTSRKNSNSLESDDEESYEYLSEILPAFLWVVRDFTLELRNENNSKLTPQEYLEMALSSSPSSTPRNSSDLKQSKNQIKDMLRFCFPERFCETLIRPVIDEEEIQKLSSPNSGSVRLRPTFSTQIRKLRRFLFSTIRPKTLNSKNSGTLMNGRMFIELLRNYCAALNFGRVVVDTCWTNVVKSEFDHSYITSKRFYRRKMMEKLKNEGKIISREPFEKIHLEVESATLRRFSKTFSFRDNSPNSSPFSKKKKESLFQDDDQVISLQFSKEQQLYEQQLQKNIRKEKLLIWDGLKKASHQYCTRLLHRSLQTIENKFSSNKSGGYNTYDSFHEDLINLLETYLSQAKGCEKETVLLATIQKFILPTIQSIHQSLVNEQVRKHGEQKNTILQQHISEMDLLKREHSIILETQQKEKDSVKSQLHKKSLKIEEILRKLEVSNTENSSLQLDIQKLKSLKNEKDLETNELHEKIEKLEKEHSSTLEKLKELKKTKEDTVRKQQQYESDSYALKMEYDSVRVANESLRQTIEFLDQKNAQLTNSVTQYCDETTKLKFRCENLETNLSSCHDSIRIQNEEISNCEIQKNEIKEEFREFRDKYSSLERYSKELELNQDGVYSQLRMSKQQIKELQRLLRLEKENLSDQEGKLRVSNAERDKLLRSSKSSIFEKQVEQLNSTNRRILQINKKVMEENKILREEVIKNGGSVRAALLLNSSVLNSLGSNTDSCSSNSNSSKNNISPISNLKIKRKEKSFFSEFLKADSPNRIIGGSENTPLLKKSNDFQTPKKQVSSDLNNRQEDISKSIQKNKNIISNFENQGSSQSSSPSNSNNRKKGKISSRKATNNNSNNDDDHTTATPEIKKVIRKQLEEIAKERKTRQQSIKNSVSPIQMHSSNHSEENLEKKNLELVKKLEREDSVKIFLDDDDISTLNYFEEVIRKSRKNQNSNILLEGNQKIQKIHKIHKILDPRGKKNVNQNHQNIQRRRNSPIPENLKIIKNNLRNRKKRILGKNDKENLIVSRFKKNQAAGKKKNSGDGGVVKRKRILKQRKNVRN